MKVNINNTDKKSKQKPIDPWSYKPWWCQPWSIVLTGTSIVAAIATVTQTVWITILGSLPVLVWWGFFLVIWPRLVKRSAISSELTPEPKQEG